MKALARLRRGIAAIVWGLFFLAFGLGAMPIQSLAHFQIGPALLSGGVIFLVLITLLTFLSGRTYCAALCPLGISQDFIGRLFKRSRHRPLPAQNWLRMLILAIFIAAFAGGFLFLFGLMDPYSAFGRIGSALFAPLLAFLNNILATGAEAAGITALTSRQIQFAGWPVFLTASLTFALLLLLVCKFGRIWCNYCPVGTGLGLIAQKSLLGMRLDQDKCVRCKQCERICKTGAINIKKGVIDQSRCVVCQNCAEICPKIAINYGRKP